MNNTNTAAISDFGTVLLFILGASLFLLIGLGASRLLRPQAPNAEKNTPYECGEEPVTSAWGQFNIRFYVIALIFILFEVELVMMFPWATVFANPDLIEKSGGTWGWFALIEMLFFVLVLVAGLAYAWAKKHLDWDKPQTQEPQIQEIIPMGAYRKYLS